jgi:malate permease and related proteins
VTLLLSIFADDILPILLVALVGFLLARYLHADVKTLSRVTLYALTPCLVFNILATSKISVAELGRMALFAVCTVLGIGLLTRLATLPLRLDRATASACMIVVMFANGGNYGLPLTLFAFGQEAMAHATIYFVVSVMLTYTVGIFLASSGHQSLRGALLSVLKMPVVYAVLAALVVVITKTTLPLPVLRPIQLLSNAAIPVMILVLGMQLERAAIPARPLLVGMATALRLVVAMALGFALAPILGLTGAARQAGVVQSAMPTAVVTTILALEFQIDPSLVTGVVFLSTLLSPFTLTLLIAFLQR